MGALYYVLRPNYEPTLFTAMYITIYVGRKKRSSESFTKCSNAVGGGSSDQVSVINVPMCKLCWRVNGKVLVLLCTLIFVYRFRHPNILSLSGFCKKPLCLVFEFMSNGSLFDRIHNVKVGDVLPVLLSILYTTAILN